MAAQRIRSRSLHAHTTAADMQAELLQRGELLRLSATTGQSLLTQTQQLQAKISALEKDASIRASPPLALQKDASETTIATTATTELNDLRFALSKLKQMKEDYNGGVTVTSNEFYNSPRKRSTNSTPVKPKTPGKARSTTISASAKSASLKIPPAFRRDNRSSSSDLYDSTADILARSFSLSLTGKQLVTGGSDNTLVADSDIDNYQQDEKQMSMGNMNTYMPEGSQGLTTFQTIQEHNEFMAAMLMEARMRQQRITELEAKDKKNTRSLSEKEYELEETRMYMLRAKEAEAKCRAQLRHLESQYDETITQLKLIEETALRSAQENSRLNIVMRKISEELDNQKMSSLAISMEVANMTKELSTVKRKQTTTLKELEDALARLDVAKEESETFKRRLAKARKVASQQAGQLRRMRRVPSKNDIASLGDWQSNDQQTQSWQLSYTPQNNNNYSNENGLANGPVPRITTPTVSKSPSLADLYAFTPTPPLRLSVESSTETMPLNEGQSRPSHKSLKDSSNGPSKSNSRITARNETLEDTPSSVDAYIFDDSSFAAQFQNEHLQSQLAKLMETISDLQTEKADWSEEKSELLELLNASREEIETLLHEKMNAADATTTGLDPATRFLSRQMGWRRGSNASDTNPLTPTIFDTKQRADSVRSNASNNPFSLASELTAVSSQLSSIFSETRSGKSDDGNTLLSNEKKSLVKAATSVAVGLSQLSNSSFMRTSASTCNVEAQTDLVESPSVISKEMNDSTSQTYGLPVMADAISQTNMQLDVIHANVSTNTEMEITQMSPILNTVNLLPADGEQLLQQRPKYHESSTIQQSVGPLMSKFVIQDPQLFMSNDNSPTKRGEIKDDHESMNNNFHSDDIGSHNTIVRHVYNSIGYASRRSSESHLVEDMQHSQKEGKSKNELGVESIYSAVEHPSSPVEAERPNDLANNLNLTDKYSCLTDEGVSIQATRAHVLIISGQPEDSDTDSTARSHIRKSLTASLVDTSPSWGGVDLTNDMTWENKDTTVQTMTTSVLISSETTFMNATMTESTTAPTIPSTTASTIPTMSAEKGTHAELGDETDDNDDAESVASVVSIDSDLSVAEVNANSTKRHRMFGKGSVSAILSKRESTQNSSTGNKQFNTLKSRTTISAGKIFRFVKKQRERASQNSAISAVSFIPPVTASPIIAKAGQETSSFAPPSSNPQSHTSKNAASAISLATATTGTIATVAPTQASQPVNSSQSSVVTSFSIDRRIGTHLSPSGDPLMAFSDISHDSLLQSSSSAHLYTSAMADVAKVMVGQFFTKYDRTVKKHHQRYFWINPPKMMVYWSKDPPIEESSHNQFRSGVILDARLCSTGASVKGRDMMTGRSTVTSNQFLIIHTKTRILHLQSQYPEDHFVWIRAVTYLRDRREQQREKGPAMAEAGLAQDCAQAASPPFMLYEPPRLDTSLTGNGSKRQLQSHTSVDTTNISVDNDLSRPTNSSGTIQYLTHSSTSLGSQRLSSTDKEEMKHRSLTSSAHRDVPADTLAQSHSRSSSSILSLVSSAFKASGSNSTSHSDVSTLNRS